MIDNNFWIDAANAWSWDAQPDIKIKDSGGGSISEELLKDPWDTDEYIDFDMVDLDASTEAMFAGGSIVLKDAPPQKPVAPVIEVEEEIPAPPKIILDTDRFDSFLEKETIEGYVECFKMLISSGLGTDITDDLKEIRTRLSVLNDSVKKFNKVYNADLSQFMEIYIPDALNMVVSYIECENASVGEDIINRTKSEIVNTNNTLLLAINDKINEIYKFATIEINAQAKALESLMNMDGYINPEFKIK